MKFSQNFTFILFIYIVFTSPINGNSQDVSNPDFKHLNIDFGVQVGIPLEDFYHTSEHIFLAGLEGNIMYHSRKMDKIYLGIGFSYLNYGLDTYYQDIIVNNNYLEVETTRQFSIYFPYVKGRIMPWNHTLIVPFLDVFLGPRAFTTSSSYSYDQAPSFIGSLFGAESRQKSIRHAEYNDWSWSYGFDIGLNLLIVKNLQFEFRIGYTDGSDVKYLIKEDIYFDTTKGSFYYTPRTSDSDIITFQISLKYDLL